MPPCPQLFCKCDTYNSFYEQQPFMVPSIALSITYIILITSITITINLKWFVYKDYYPLKQKSPILCMMLSTALCLNLLFYPIIYVYNYLTLNFNSQNVKLFLRATQISIQYTPYIIYFIRAMRIVYAHQCTIKHKKTRIFQMFKNQALLGLFVFLVCILRALPVLFDPFDQSSSHFRLLIEYSTRRIDPFEQVPFLYHYFSAGFCLKLLLIYCLYLQKTVHKRYTMRIQLTFIIITQILAYLPIITFSLTQEQRKHGILLQMCQQIPFYPLTEVIKTFRLISLFIISILIPLTQKKIYHKFLPSPRIHGFIKTMRDFLMDKQNLKIFQKFLKHLDEQQQTQINTALLKLWKDLIVLRYKQYIDQLQKLEKLREILEQYQEIIFQNKKQLIIQLKSSIDSLEQELNSSGIMNQQSYNQLNKQIKYLQKAILTKLDKIYWQKYTKTQSYYQLRQITCKNRNTNINMVMLNMALIIDQVSDNS